MRVFLDTNILLSAALFPGGTVSRAYDKAVTTPNRPIISDYVVDELRRVFARKFPAKNADLTSFLASLASCAEVVFTPDEPELQEDEVRDPNDRPILRAALASEADVLLTGDKDLLEAGIDNPRVMSPADFLNE